MEKYDNEMYSIVDPPYLCKFIQENMDPLEITEYSQYLKVHRAINERPELNCISLSLFAQHLDNEAPSHSLPDFADKNGPWYTKYYASFLKFIRDFNASSFYPTFKIRVYLENQLFHWIEDLCQMSDHLEIYYMARNSIGAQPGMLWRFLAFDDKRVDVVFCSDIDVEFNGHVVPRLQKFLQSSKTFGRLLACCTDYTIDRSNPESSPLNYTVCNGSMLAIRPKQLDISMHDTMVNYIAYRKYRSSTARPTEEYNNRNTDRFNKPIGSHRHGWGGIWTMYGFDEKLLKHTLFPHLVQKGEVLSWVAPSMRVLQESRGDEPYMVDYQFTNMYDNEFVDFA